jgi:hypothetical protein
MCLQLVSVNSKDEDSKMKFSRKLNRVNLVVITLCLTTSLGMSYQVWSSSPFIGLMLGVITAGVYIMLISGKWITKNT